MDAKHADRGRLIQLTEIVLGCVFTVLDTHGRLTALRTGLDDRCDFTESMY